MKRLHAFVFASVFLLFFASKVSATESIPQILQKHLQAVQTTYLSGEKNGNFKNHASASMDLLLYMEKLSLAQLNQNRTSLIQIIQNDGTLPHLSWLIEIDWRLKSDSSKESQQTHSLFKQAYLAARTKDKSREGKNKSYVFIKEKRFFGEGYRAYSGKVGVAATAIGFSLLGEQSAKTGDSASALVGILQQGITCDNVEQLLRGERGVFHANDDTGKRKL